MKSGFPTRGLPLRGKNRSAVLSPVSVRDLITDTLTSSDVVYSATGDWPSLIKCRSLRIMWSDGVIPYHSRETTGPSQRSTQRPECRCQQNVSVLYGHPYLAHVCA